MRRVILVGLAFLGAGATGGIAQDPDTKDQEKKIAALCRELGSDDPEIRELATRDLVGFGRPALKAMTKLLESDDVEVKARAQRVIREVQAALRPKALRLRVGTDKKTYRPGEKVHVTAKLENVEDFPVIATRFIWDGGLTADSWIRVYRDGKPVNFAGDPLPQVMVHGKVTEDRFVTVPPKKSVAVRGIDFEKAWDLGGKDPSLKASYAEGKLVPLSPGKYRVKATYAFRFDRRLLEESAGEQRPRMLRRTFSGNSKEMLRDAWRGSLSVEGEFEVTEK